MGEKLKAYQYILIILVLSLTFILTYNRHTDYQFPYHHDEWQHLGISMQAVTAGYNIGTNPFTGATLWYKDLESGFHIFLAETIILSDLDPIFSYKYLAAIFAALAVLSIFMCIYYFTNNFFIGIISGLVFISLKSNVNILGKEFFVPLTMSFFIVFMFIYSFHKGIKENEKRFLFLSAIIFFFLFFIYPPSFLILLPSVILELIIRFKSSMFNTSSKIIILILVLLICSISLFYFLWRGNLYVTKEYLFDLLLFEKGWGKLEISYFIPYLYGLICTCFALYGLVKSFFTMRFFTLSAFISLAITAIFNKFGFSIIVPYSRAVHYSMIFLIPFTAIGLYEIIKNKKTIIKYALISVFFIIIMNSTYEIDTRYKDYESMPLYKEDYDAISWIKGTYGTGKMIVAPYFMTSTIYPLSGSKTIALIPAQLSGGFINETLGFYNYPCEKKYSIIKESHADLVYSNSPISCDFLKPAYTKERFIYEIT